MFFTRCSFLTALLLLTGLLSAQSAEYQLSTTAEEVVVTGSKFARPLSDSPEPVTIIDSAAIARSADLSQLLNEQAGIVINGAYSNPGKDRSIFLRNAGNSFTVILIDGQPLLDPSSLGGAVDLRLLSLEGIERIEILRGAKSLLYGSDAIAGVINLVTRNGAQSSASNKPVVHLRAAAQSIPAVEAGASIAGTTEKLDYRLGLDYFASSGISEATEPEGATDEFADDEATRQSLNASLTYRPIPELSIRPSVRLASFTGDYDAGSFQDGDNDYENELFLPSVAVDYTTEKVNMGARYSYAQTDRTFNDGNFGPSFFNGLNQQTDVFASYLGDSGLNLTGGVQHRRESLTNEDVQNARDLIDATTVSPYLQAGATLGKNVLLEGGLRFNKHSNFGGQLNYSAAAGYKIGKGFVTRLSLSSAFQNPTLDQLGGPFGANPELDPQTALSLEVGLNYRDPDGAANFGLSVFRRDVEDLIIFDFAEGYQNRDELTDTGVELTGTLNLGKGLLLNYNSTYVYGKLTNNDGTGTETNEFFRRPRNTGMLGLTYDSEKRFTARLSAHYTGERPDVWFDANFARTEVELEPYLLVNAYAEYRLLEDENLRLFVDGKNITNTDFVEVTGFSTLGAVVRVGASLRL